jgi:hypothetical protein
MMQQRGLTEDLLRISALPKVNGVKLELMLIRMFGTTRVHLDHDPPLMLRRRTRNGGYKPDANDPEHLIYRTAEEHFIKTWMRGDGAQLSDAGKRRKELRRQRKLDPRRRKRKWPKRNLHLR